MADTEKLAREARKLAQELREPFLATSDVEALPASTFTSAARLLDRCAAALSPRPATGGMECHKLDTPTQVFFYEQDFYVLSNFSAFNLQWKGWTFPTSEHAYHWEKFYGVAPAICDLIRQAPSAHEAFKTAEEFKDKRRPDWDNVKLEVMRQILRAKAAQHEYVRRKLVATGDRELIEDSWRDDFWGWGPNRDGQNWLGRLWAEIRTECRAAAALDGAPAAPDGVELPPNPMNSLEPWAVARARKAAQSFLHCCEDVGFDLPNNILGMAATDMELCARGVLAEARKVLNIFGALWREAEKEADELRAKIAALPAPTPAPEPGVTSCPECAGHGRFPGGEKCSNCNGVGCLPAAPSEPAQDAGLTDLLLNTQFTTNHPEPGDLTFQFGSHERLCRFIDLLAALKAAPIPVEVRQRAYDIATLVAVHETGNLLANPNPKSVELIARALTAAKGATK